VSDHCRGIAAVIERGRPGETYNLGGRSESENMTLVRALCSAADAAFREDASLVKRFPGAAPARGLPSESLITMVRDRPGHDRRYAIDCTKAENELGFRCEMSLEQGLRATLRWYLDNEAWWRAVIDGSYREWIARQYGV
jgi:dTDP-glucose 4,6-dehydratase